MLNYLDRFLSAQENVYLLALDEIRTGRKRSHWIWFIFPQLQGLGRSDMAIWYGLPDLEAAEEYAAHPVLGMRLREITRALLHLEETDIHCILPYPDDLKVCSCMTLFALAMPNEPIFRQVLDKYYGGKPCEKTLALLGFPPNTPLLERIVKPAFTVIGMEGSTDDGPGFIQALWEKANCRFSEVASLAGTTPDGTLCGVWGAMTDPSRSFLPWTDGFSRGLYLAGVEAREDAAPPAGWTKWVIPGFEYLRVASTTPDIFSRTLDAISASGRMLAGAVHDFTDPATGKMYMLFPIQKL